MYSLANMQSGKQFSDTDGPCTSSRLQNFCATVHHFVVVACWLLLLWQASSSVQLYLQGRSTYTESLVTGQPIPLPPVTLCPDPPYDPRLLAQLGVDLNASSSEQLYNRVLDLEGQLGNLTVAEVVEAAAWGVGDLVQDFQSGSLRQAYQSKSRVLPKLWSRSFLPWGPCLTLTLPLIPVEVNNLTITLQDPLFGLQRCIQEGDPDYDLIFGTDCEVIEQRCNTTCAWEDFLVWSTGVDSIMYGVSDAYKFESIAIHTWKHSLPQKIHLEAYQVIHLKKSKQITMESFYNSLYAGVAEEHNCKILSTHNLRYPIRNICSAKLFTDSADTVKSYSNMYVSRHLETRWQKLQLSNVFATDYSQRKSFISWEPHMRQVRESLIYPFSALVADIGGSLGLFVGVAILPMWNSCIQLLPILRSPLTLTSIKLTSGSFTSCRHLKNICWNWWQHLLNIFSSRFTSKEVGSFGYSPNIHQTFQFRSSKQQVSGTLDAMKRQIRHIYNLLTCSRRLSKLNGSGNNKKKTCSSSSKKYQTVGNLMGMLVFSGAVVLQTSVSLMDIFSDNTVSVTAVSLVPQLSDSSSTKEDRTANLSLSEAITGRLASWALGCKVIPPTPHLQCLVKCSLKGDLSFSKAFLPFINVLDLPKCTKDTARGGVEYVVASKLSRHITDEIPKECKKCLRKSNMTTRTGELQHKVAKKAKKNPEDLLYDLGGIIGFYLGYSLFGAIRYLCSRFAGWEPRRRVGVLTVQLMLVLLAAALCVSRLSTFLYHQPIWMQVSTQAFRTDMFPAVTLCQWPPFNLSLLLHAAGHPPLPHHFDLLSPQRQQQFVLGILEHLSSNSSSSLSEAWKLAQWDLRHILRAQYSVPGTNTIIYPHWKTHHSTILGSCYTLTYNSSVYFEEKIKLRIIISSISSETRQGHYLYIVIHEQGNNPPFFYRSVLNKMIGESLYIDVKSKVTYQGTNPVNIESYADCIQQCLDKVVETEIGCCPICQLSSDKEFQSCNDTQVERLLAAQWGSFSQLSDFYLHVTSEDRVNECWLACRDRRQEFYYVKLHSRMETVLPNGVTVRVVCPTNAEESETAEKLVVISMDNNPQESVEEYVGYTLPQLLSDVGGVIGVVTGASLLSVLLGLLNKARKSPKTEN